MRTSIFIKLFLSLAAIGFATVGIVAVTMIFSLHNGLQDFVNKREQKTLEPLTQLLASKYQENHSWDFLHNDPMRLQDLFHQTDIHIKSDDRAPKETTDKAPPLPTGKNSPRMPMDKTLPPPDGERQHTPPHHSDGNSPQRLMPLLGERIGLADASGKILIESRAKHLRNNCNCQQLPIQSGDGLIIGYLRIMQADQLSDDLALSLIEQQKRALFITVIAALLIAALFAALLVRHFLKPLHALNQATYALADGQLDYRVVMNSRDEFGELTQNFNKLAARLQKQKQTRDRWLSDISHELRTPLTVLRSEIEAIQDGIRQPKPEYIDSLHDQVHNLSKLVNDLHTLSLTEIDEHYHFTDNLDLSTALMEIIQRHQLRFTEKGITINTDAVEKNVRAFADSHAINQVIGNLLQNSRRYTNNGGWVDISLTTERNRAVLSIADSAPGVPDEALSHLFERLYRVDDSRTRSNQYAGGTGLGLAICENIIKAHNGTIVAEHSELGGLKTTITLPLSYKKTLK